MNKKYSVLALCTLVLFALSAGTVLGYPGYATSTPNANKVLDNSTGNVTGNASINATGSPTVTITSQPTSDILQPNTTEDALVEETTEPAVTETAKKPVVQTPESTKKVPKGSPGFEIVGAIIVLYMIGKRR